MRGRPRTPLAIAEATGRTAHDPKRFRDRKEPLSALLGEPSSVMDDLERIVWEAFKREIPWLTEADRSTVESACMLRAQLWAGSRDVKVIGKLLTYLNQMGATPASRSKVAVPDTGGESSDPADKYIN